MGMSGRNVFVDTLPKRKSGKSGMALMWRNGKACNAKMDGMSAVLWQCQCRTAAEETIAWIWQVRQWLLWVFLPWLAEMAMKA